MEVSVNTILNKASEKISFDRVRYNDKNIPTNISNVVCMTFFGDIKSQFFFSSIALKRIKEELYGSKYFIFCSWPGQKEIYPYVDEYWQPKDEEILKQLYLKSNEKNDNFTDSVKRYLNSYMPEDIIDVNVFDSYYKNGFKQDFFERFGFVKLFLPSIPSISVLGSDFSKKILTKNNRIFIYPTTHIQIYRNGKVEFVNIYKEFWNDLIDYFILKGLNPIIFQDFLTYDVSSEYYDKCLIYKNKDLINVLSLMRGCDFVLDIFSGISKYSMMARTPFISVQDRNKFMTLKEYEIDDLCSKDLPKEYVYIFPDICDMSNKNVWIKTLFDVIINKIEKMSNLNRDDLPPPIELEKKILYSNVRNINKKKFGTKFIKIEKF